MINDLKPLLQIIEHIPVEYSPFIILFVLVIFSAWWGRKRHLLCKLEAYQQIRHLKQKAPEQQMTHLRGVNPYVFEEMVLTAIKKQGHKITRNKRYSGDGGIDGRCNINGFDYLIQSKRYKSYINPAHVQAFNYVCKKHYKKGLFIHTGKTGAKSKQIAQRTNIEIISGQRLLNLLLNKPKDHF